MRRLRIARIAVRKEKERNNESSVNRGCDEISMVNRHIKIDGMAVPK